MTRKTNDSIGHFGRSFLTRRQENKEYAFDLDELNLLDHDSLPASLKGNLLSFSPSTDTEIKEIFTFCIDLCSPTRSEQI